MNDIRRNGMVLEGTGSSLRKMTASQIGSVGGLAVTIAADQIIPNYIVTMDGSFEPCKNCTG